MASFFKKISQCFHAKFLMFLHFRSVLLDLFIVARPAQLLHFLHPTLFGLCYLIFSVVYWAVGGTDPEGHHWIYPMVDWDRPGLAVGTAVGCIVGKDGVI